jgi:hypothetical protein
MKPVYIQGTSLEDIIDDGWSRGFEIQQTVDELHAQGFTDADEALVKEHWDRYDADYTEIYKSKWEFMCLTTSG